MHMFKGRRVKYVGFLGIRSLGGSADAHPNISNRDADHGMYRSQAFYNKFSISVPHLICS